MRQKLFAAGIGIALTSLAAVGAFASQDGVQVLEDTPTVEVTETPIDATETPVDATQTPEATTTPEDGTPTPDATGTPEATATGEPEATATGEPEATATSEPEATPTEDDGGEEDGIHGIPDSNPAKHPEDGDGICEKGETVVKTTPSGNQVNVPCNAVKDSIGGDAEDGESDAAATDAQGGKKKNKGRGRR